MNIKTNAKQIADHITGATIPNIFERECIDLIKDINRFHVEIAHHEGETSPRTFVYSFDEKGFSVGYYNSFNGLKKADDNTRFRKIEGGIQAIHPYLRAYRDALFAVKIAQAV